MSFLYVPAVQHKLLRKTVNDTRQMLSNFKEIVNEAIDLVTTITRDMNQLQVVGKKNNVIGKYYERKKFI